MIGETIKDFKLVEKLGSGGMGEVWIAEQQLIKTRVAIKFLRPEISTDKQQVQRFFNEAIAVSKIKHAGIVKIFDVGTHDGRAYLIMELLEGESLASRIARRRLAIGEVADVGRQIASILGATHAAGITHRDLKPDNIFLVPDAELASKERVKILDFGIAKLGATTGATALTATGGSMGTPAYMAPEQWRDAARADARADVYALGCVTFEMCCARPPFVAASIGEACTKHLTEVPPRARATARDIPAELDAMIARMLAKAVDDRPGIGDVAAVFDMIAAARPAASQPTLRAQPAARGVLDTTLGAAASSVRSEPSRRPKLLVVAGVVALAAVGGVMIWKLRSHDDTRPAAQTTPPPPPVMPDAAPRPVVESISTNAWIKVVPPATPVTLGLADNDAPDERKGFRPARAIKSPTSPYEIQQHEVTWEELDPFVRSKGLAIEYPPWTRQPRLPATGVTWSQALAYCQSIGATLPTEEQWEYAARGAQLRPSSWGADRLDRMLTHAYAGPTAEPAAVETSPQDETPDHIFDLIGNAQEWTMGLWREDKPNADESNVSSGETTVRAIRGFPLAVAPPATIQAEGAAYRERLCATGPCVAKGRKLRQYIGFRCVRAVH